MKTASVVFGSGTPIHFGISTCPNDTFAAAALLEGRVDTGGFEWHVELLDIQQLNARLSVGDFDVAKTSFAAAVKSASEFWVLPVGSALGFGVGPLLLAGRAGEVPRHADQLTLCPGPTTTAMFLFQTFYPGTTRVEQVVFSDIMPAIAEGRADFGVCIHEGRFTFAESGLHRIADLGELWEERTGSPLPLGGLVARTRLDQESLSRVVAVLDDSLAAARACPASAMPMMRRFAAELSDEVLMAHVDLYVNDWTVDFGTVGANALRCFSALARQSEWAAEDAELRIFPRS